MKGFMLITNYFEDIEGLGTLDLIRRAGIQIDLVSITGDLNITTQSNVKIVVDKLVENINYLDYDFVVLPGGKAINNDHYNNPITLKIIKDMADAGKLVAAICAAPRVLAKLGLLDNLDFTCFPTCEQGFDKPIYHGEKKVVRVKNLITSKACGTTFEFAKEIISYLLDEDSANKVINNTYYK